MSKSILLFTTFLAIANATPITVNYMTGAIGQGSGDNSIVKNMPGETVTANAWGVTGNNDTTFQWATLGQYSGLGLGVCNQAELSVGCTAPQHEVDDNGQLDFVMFSFSAPVTSVSITVTPVCNCDTNASYIVGNGLDPLGLTLAQLPAVQNSNEITKDTTRTITLNGLGNGVTDVLFGASVTGTNNFFKIESLSYTQASGVPEPATLALAGIALLGLGALKHRKANVL